MAKSKKLNSMRVLEQHDIPYEVFEYDASTRDAAEVAEMIGAPPEQVYKTLVVQPVDAPTKPALVLLASERRLDLKQMAAALGAKKVKMAPHTEAEKLTGLQVGGISPLMLIQKNWPVFLDEPATKLQFLYLSAGQRGYQLRVPVTPLLTLLRARVASVSEV